jgi:hypothetical protein
MFCNGFPGKANKKLPNRINAFALQNEMPIKYCFAGNRLFTLGAGIFINACKEKSFNFVAQINCRF